MNPAPPVTITFRAPVFLAVLLRQFLSTRSLPAAVAWLPFFCPCGGRQAGGLSAILAQRLFKEVMCMASMPEPIDPSMPGNRPDFPPSVFTGCRKSTLIPRRRRLLGLRKKRSGNFRRWNGIRMESIAGKQPAPPPESRGFAGTPLPFPRRRQTALFHQFIQITAITVLFTAPAWERSVSWEIQPLLKAISSRQATLDPWWCSRVRTNAEASRRVSCVPVSSHV